MCKGLKKGQTVLTQELDNKIIALYGLGMGYRDISSHIEDIYGIEISKSSITAITDKILPKIKEWQNRPLEEIYPIIFLDAMHFKCSEEGKVIRVKGVKFIFPLLKTYLWKYELDPFSRLVVG